MITRDPLDGVNGTPVETNPYHYADNDPLNKTDPTGMRPKGPSDTHIRFELGQDAKSRFGRLGKVEMSGFIKEPGLGIRRVGILQG